MLHLLKHKTTKLTYPGSNRNESCDYRCPHHVDMTLLGRLHYLYLHYQTVSTPHSQQPTSPVGIQLIQKPTRKMALSWEGRWDPLCLHLFYSRIQSSCCDHIRHQEVSLTCCFYYCCLHRPI